MSNISLNSILNEFQNSDKLIAFNKLKKFTKENPKDIIALYNLGYMCEILKKIDEAITIYKKVLIKNKLHWQSRFNLSLIFFKKKQYDKCLPLLEEVLKINPVFHPALREKANVYFHQDKIDDAKKIIENFIKLNPNDSVGLNIQGLIYLKSNELQKAKEVFLKGIEISPNYYPILNNLSTCFRQLEEPKIAIEYLKKTLKISPNFIEGIINMGALLIETGKYNEGIKYLKSVKEKTKSNAVNLNLAIGYFFNENFDEAEKYFQCAEKEDPTNDNFKKNYSSFLIYKQEYQKAWKMLSNIINKDKFIIPGSYMNNIKEKLSSFQDIEKNDNILLIKEQGVGDEILFSSIYNDLLNTYPNTIIETDERLISLFKRSFKSDNFVPYKKISSSKDQLKNYKKVVFAGNLPSKFRNTKTSFPQKAFLRADSTNIKNIKETLDKKCKKIKIGFSWLSKRKFFGEEKSINLNSFLPILKMPEISFINLQYGNYEKEIEDLNKKEKLKIINYPNIDLFNDFENLAALLVNLDLFITISSSTAHLAGGLGVPTWLIKPKNNASFHYWFQPNDKTPWYPSITLFSQTKGCKDTIKKIKNKISEKFDFKN